MLFELLDSESVNRVLRTHMTIAFRTGEPPVFVFAGSRDNLIELTCSYFNTKVPKSDLTGFYGLSVFEVRDYSIVLVGRQADIDRVLSDETLLFQAHLMAYSSTCPQCRGAVLPITIECGGPRWNGICNKCSSVYHVEMGILFVYDLKIRSFVLVDSKPVPASAPPGLPSPADVSEPESPDPPPKTWRQFPPLC